MNERDREIGIDSAAIGPEVADRVGSIISAAEAAARSIRARAEQTAETTRLETEAHARRRAEEAERQAATRRREAEAEALRYLNDARLRADRLVAERAAQISDLSDSVLERAQSLLRQLDNAETVRRQLSGLAQALGETAERLARDAASGATAFASDPSPPIPAPEVESPVAPPGLDAADLPRRSRRFARRRLESVDPVEPSPPDGLDGGEEGADPASIDAPGAAERPRGDGDPAAFSPSEEADGARLVALQMAVAGSSRGEVASHLRATFNLSEPDIVLDDVFGEGSSLHQRLPFR